MAADPLTPAVSDRICRHMNQDHAEAVLAYARHYGGLVAARQARLLSVGPEAMRLEVDGTPVEILPDPS
jgi:putative heme iron utilization protein